MLQEFSWDSSVKNTILSSFFWGYVCTQVIGSVIAQRWSAQKLYAIGQFVCGLVTLLLPVLAHYFNWEAVCASRVIAGLCQGTVLPCLHTLLSKWVPPEERGRMCKLFCTYYGNRIFSIKYFFKILFYNY